MTLTRRSVLRLGGAAAATLALGKVAMAKSSYGPIGCFSVNMVAIPDDLVAAPYLAGFAEGRVNRYYHPTAYTTHSIAGQVYRDVGGLEGARYPLRPYPGLLPVQVNVWHPGPVGRVLAYDNPSGGPLAWRAARAGEPHNTYIEEWGGAPDLCYGLRLNGAQGRISFPNEMIVPWRTIISLCAPDVANPIRPSVHIEGGKKIAEGIPFEPDKIDYARRDPDGDGTGVVTFFMVAAAARAPAVARTRSDGYPEYVRRLPAGGAAAYGQPAPRYR